MTETLYSEGPGFRDIQIERDKGEILDDFGSPLAYTVDGRYFLYQYQHGAAWSVGDLVTPVVGAILFGADVGHGGNSIPVYELPESHTRGFALVEFDRRDNVERLELYECGEGSNDKICGQAVTDVFWATIVAINGEAQTKQYRIALESIEQKTRSLLQAISDGHFREIDRQIKEGADVNAIVNGGTALHLAAQSGNFDTVKLLIDRKAAVAAIDLNGRTPLHLAAESGRVEIAQLLLEQGVNVDARDSRGSTPLFGAVENQHISMVRWLLDSGASITLQNQSQATALNAAVRNDDVAMVKLLLEKGVAADQATIDAALAVIKTKNVAALNQNQSIDVTGRYVSNITRSGIHAGIFFTKNEYRTLIITLEQSGNIITGTDSYETAVIEGRRDGDNIVFRFWSPVYGISSNIDLRGTWTINPDGNSLTGKCRKGSLRS